MWEVLEPQEKVSGKISTISCKILPLVRDYYS